MRNMRMTAIAMALCTAAVIGEPAQADTSPLVARLTDSATHWTNQGGSTMSLVLDCDQDQFKVCQVSGNYINNEAGFLCQGTPYPLVGVYYINTQTISWSVAWSNAAEDCQSVTGWTGYLTISTNGLQFVTDWNLAYRTDGNPSIEQGSDTFTLQPMVSSSSLLNKSRKKQ